MAGMRLVPRRTRQLGEQWECMGKRERDKSVARLLTVMGEGRPRKDPTPPIKILLSVSFFISVPDYKSRKKQSRVLFEIKEYRNNHLKQSLKIQFKTWHRCYSTRFFSFLSSDILKHYPITFRIYQPTKHAIGFKKKIPNWATRSKTFLTAIANTNMEFFYQL